MPSVNIVDPQAFDTVKEGCRAPAFLGPDRPLPIVWQDSLGAQALQARKRVVLTHAVSDVSFVMMPFSVTMFWCLDFFVRLDPARDRGPVFLLIQR
jgi:hypothetical protein